MTVTFKQVMTEVTDGDSE